MTEQPRRLSTIERAMQLARSSGCTNVAEIKRALSQEGFSGVDVHLSGSATRKQLQLLIKARNTSPSEAA